MRRARTTRSRAGTLSTLVTLLGVLAALGGGCTPGEDAAEPLRILAGGKRADRDLHALTTRIARRVERLRGLEFRRVPSVSLVSREQLAELGARLTRRRRANESASGLRRSDRFERAKLDFQKLAGLVPRGLRFSPDATTGIEVIAGAYDYSRGRVVVVPEAITSRLELEYTLAHELGHALDDQHFRLHFRGVAPPNERSSVRRAVIEGTATLNQYRYRRRYLGDETAVPQRLAGVRSVLRAGAAPYAVSAQAAFEYVDGTLFVRALRRRGEGWSLVNRALARPPHTSRDLLHPSRWPRDGAIPKVTLNVRPLLADEWRRVGRGPAGEQDALAILAAGSEAQARSASHGWKGGRFEVWRARQGRSCEEDCTVGVIAFRWRRPRDADEFALALPAYAILGLGARREDEGLWELAGGFLAHARAARASALGFAPTAALATAVAEQAALGRRSPNR